MARLRQYRSYSGRRSPSGEDFLLSVLFFPAAILYHELLLRLFDANTPFFTLALLRILLFSVAAGLLIHLILTLLPWKLPARIIGGVLLFVGAVIFCVERGCRSMFGLYYGLFFMGGMAGDVVGGFGSTVWSVFLGIIPFILLSLVPFVVFILLRERVVPEQEELEPPMLIILAAAMVACQLIAFLLSTLGGVANYYTYDYTANVAVPHFGLVSTVRLELEYAVVGIPEIPLDQFIDDPVESFAPAAPSDQPAPDDSAAPGNSAEPDPSQTPEVPVEYGYNMLDIDFDALAEAADNDNIKAMHQFYAGATPSQQNQYTGMFEGKNLIMITAEAFSPYVISEELTPTLYRLTHEGFVFNNYYQPDWTQSTSGGEFAAMTGIIPSWIDGRTAFFKSRGVYFPFALGNQFTALGYNVYAWHNGLYDYYNRHETHPNLGYANFMGKGNGLELPSPTDWPASDLEMVEVTADSYIQCYLDTGTPFHAYYMTISGHTPYNFGGDKMAVKNREAAVAAYPDASETVQAYIAANLELEYAMAYLVDKLEAAGIADDTLIVLTADHYPYSMAEGSVDYYNELRGFEDTEKDTSRYRNTLIMWSAAIKEPVIVDTPCSSIDIIPTVSNLFGLEFDSRLLSGHDIFATNYEADQYSNCMPLVVFANTGFGNSWITAAGTYEAATRTFTPNEGITVADDYVTRVSRLVQARISYARLILQQDYYRTVFDPQ